MSETISEDIPAGPGNVSDESPAKELPTKALKVIFKSLPCRDINKCRAVCKQWLTLIDEILKKDDRWRKYCKKDFKDVYKLARSNSPNLSWFNLYKSLSLWPKLNQANLTGRLLTPLEAVGETYDIEYFEIFDNKIGVHLNGYIDYFDLETSSKLKNRCIDEIFSKYRENKDLVAVINIYKSRLLVCPKTGEFDRNISFQEEFLEVEQNVKDFVLVDLNVYYITENGDINVCKITNELKDSEKFFINQFKGNALALSYTNHLNILTDQYEIYSASNNEFKLQYSYKTSGSLFEKLRKYNFLDIKWKDVYRFIASKHVEDSLVDVMWNISTMKAYGNILFVGTETGNLVVYNLPNNKFNLSALRPVKEFYINDIVSNERAKIPHNYRNAESPNHLQKVLRLVNVVEVENGHDVYVATVNNLVVLELRHDGKRRASEAGIHVKNVKVLKKA